MEVSYRDKKLKKLLENKKRLFASFGSECGKKLNQRLMELQAADNLLEMPPAARAHPHKGNRKGLFSLDLKHPRRLIIRPIGSCDIQDYSTIVEVEIFEIMDPH